MIILAVDYGDARTGLAICDKGEFMASPVGVLTEYNKDVLAQKIADKAKELSSELIVVGNPINMDASRGPRSQMACELGDKIKLLSGIETVMWDERSTTVSATNYLNQADVRGKKRKAVIDAVAAVIILDSYLSYRRNHRG